MTEVIETETPIPFELTDAGMFVTFGAAMALINDAVGNDDPNGTE